MAKDRLHYLIMDGMTAMALEERHCACGCGGSFRCTIASQARFTSITHDPSFNFQDFMFPKRRRHRSGGIPESELVYRQSQDDDSDDPCVREIMARKIGGDGEPSVGAALQVDLDALEGGLE